MFDVITPFDTTITGFLYSIVPHTFVTDQIFAFFSMDGLSLLVWVIAAIPLFLFEGRQDKKFIFYFLVSFFITAVFVNIVLKNMFARERPPLPITHTSLYECPTDYGFPSGHASAAFASATVLAYFDKKRRVFYYSIAVLISYSRVYLSCHYVLDIVAGGLIGYGISYLLLHVAPPHVTPSTRSRPK